MKTIKKIFIALLTIVLLNLLVVFTVSLNLQKMVKEDLIKQIIKEEFLTTDFQTDSKTSLTENEKINDLLESKEAQEIVDKYLDITIDSFIDEEKNVEVTIEEDLLNYLKNNKKFVEEKLGVEVTNEMIAQAKEQLESKELSNIFKQNINNSKNSMPKEAKTILKIYKYLISLQFQLILIAIILLDILLIAVLKSSLYKWLSTLGYTSIVAGIGLLIMSLIVKITIISISTLQEVSLSSLITAGIILILFGLILIIIKKILDIKLVKEDEHEVSKVSSEEW